MTITDSRLRSLEIINFEEHPSLPIHIIGMGAVGSRVFEQLVCLGCRNIHCYDFDHVEAHNLHNQLWITADIGKTKVEAARGWMIDKYSIDPSDSSITFNKVMVDKNMASQMEGIVMSCVDTFDGRRHILEGCVKSGKVRQFIEGRCAPTFNNVRCVDPADKDQVEAFMASLGNDDDPDTNVSICGLPISFAPVMIACGTMMVMQCINFIKNGVTWEDNRFTNFISSPMLVLSGQDL